MSHTTKELASTAIQTAWNVVFDRFFYPPTNLIYDFLTADDLEGTFQNMVTPENIACNVPNPCGWGTGMEDSVLNGGSMLEAAIARYNATKDESMREVAAKLFAGLYRCGTVSTQVGFLARSVHPSDNTSHYIDSSRDQYTHWVYCTLLYYLSELSTPDEKAQITQVLVNFAQKAERDVTAENGWYLLREDGKPGVVCGMRKDASRPHEALRLPMIYLAAYVTSKNSHWLDCYHECREEALQQSEELTYEEACTYSWAYALLQMQYSIRLLYNHDPDPEYKARYLAQMQMLARVVPHYVEDVLSTLDSLPENTRRKPWKECLAYLHVFFSGSAYYIPSMKSNLNDTKYTLFSILRNAAEAVAVQALCPGCDISQESHETFYKIVSTVPFADAVDYWPVLYCNAWWLLQEKDLT